MGRKLDRQGATRALRLLEHGEVVAGIYQVGDLLGEGGMGQVFEATDLGLDRSVAIKVAWTDMGPDALVHEARVMAAFRNEGLTAVHAMGSHNGIRYTVMERLRGMTLADHMDQRLDVVDFTIPEIVELLLGICRPLQALHHARLAHRDVKPENVMLAPPNRVVLMDYGVLVAENSPSAISTAAGTPTYVAPEMCANSSEPGQAFASDIYSLGVIAYELLTGEPPFDGCSVLEILSAHVTEPVPDLRAARPDAPESLIGLVEEMLAKNPRARPPSVQAVVSQLELMRVATAAKPSARPLSLMIIDDDPLMSDWLEALAIDTVPDADPRQATSADRALTEFATDPPDVCLLDLEMPDMNGLELAMYLRSTSLADNTQFVVVSSHVGAPERELFHHLGISEFAPKGESLQRELQAILRRISASHKHTASAVQRMF